MKKINLNSYTDQFRTAPIFAKKGVIAAIQVTPDGLESGLYADKGVRFDEKSDRYVIDTYVMREKDGKRVAELEDTHEVVAGHWIATNPKKYESDRDNNYPIPDATFRKRYEPTDQEGVFRAKGMCRIIPNDTGEDVEIDAPWGGSQNGDAKCYFCAPYDPENPEDLAIDRRYLLSENDFAAYGPADEVLGAGWDK